MSDTTMPDVQAEPVQTAAEPTAQTDIEKLTEEELLAKVIEYKTIAQRATADYRNLQRETEQRMKEMRLYAGESIIEELCPLVDYFNSAFAAVPEAEQKSSWLQGVRHIQTYLMSILQNHQVVLIDTVGVLFDPKMHETVSEEVSDKPDHTVIKIAQPGFMLNGKVIRPAKVIVAKEKDIPEEKIENKNNELIN